MIIMGLIALLTILLGDNNLPFLLPREEKAFNKVIDDKVKLKQLEFIANGIKEEEKKYRKNRKTNQKELEELNLSRSASAEEFNIIAKSIQKTNKDAFSYMVKARLTISLIITSDEWAAILEESKLRYNKRVKKYEKIYPKFEKAIDDVINRVEKTISDKDKALIIAERLKAFSQLTLFNAQKISKYNVYDHPVLNNISSTENELIAVGPEILELRNEVVYEYIAIHNLIAKSTTADEWPKIVKEVNKLF